MTDYLNDDYLNGLLNFTIGLIVQCYTWNFKVSFSTSKSLYTSLRPREPAIKGKYGVPNVVYKYHCSACDKRYIGYTTRPIKSALANTV